MLRCSGPSGQIYSWLFFFVFFSTHFFPCSYALRFQWCCSLPALLPRVHLQAASASALSPRIAGPCELNPSVDEGLVLAVLPQEPSLPTPAPNGNASMPPHISRAFRLAGPSPPRG